MASNLRRSKRTFGQRFLRTEQRVDAAGRRPTPRRIGSRVVTSSNLAPGAVSTVVLADDVTTIINYAQATADGKNTIYYQDNEPTGGTYAEDDIWFDTDDDNKLYRYNGTAWIGFQLGDNAIEELSADKLTAGTIDARDITVSNIDAGEITVGELNAVDIGAVDITGATITGGSLDIGSGTFEVDNLGNLTATSATITGGTITIGSGDTVFKVDSDGNMWLGDAVYADAEFKVSNAGALVATSATITGTINASSGSITGSLSAGDVRIGSDVRQAGHDGIVLVSTSWDNAWVRRDNTVDPAYRNTVYFRAGTSTTYVQLDTGPGVSEINFNNGVFKVTDAGDLTATSATITGTISSSTITSPSISWGVNTINVYPGLNGIGIDATYGSIQVGAPVVVGLEGNYHTAGYHEFSSTTRQLFSMDNDGAKIHLHSSIFPSIRSSTYTLTGFGVNNDEALMQADGFWGVLVSNVIGGPNSPEVYINARSNSTGTVNCQINSMSGELTYPTSRRSVKNTIEDVENPLSVVKLLQAKTFFYNQSDKDTEIENALKPMVKHVGFIAEEVAEASSVSGLFLHVDGADPDDDAPESLDELVPVYWRHDSVLALAIGAINELSEKLTALEAKVS